MYHTHLVLVPFNLSFLLFSRDQVSQVFMNTKLSKIHQSVDQIQQQQQIENLQYSIFLAKPLHCKEISFRKLFVKNGFRQTSDGYFINYRLSCLSNIGVYPNIGEKLKCVLEQTNRHSNTAIKVVRNANEKIGHILDGLSKTY